MAKAFKYTFPAGSWQLCNGETEHVEMARDVAPGLIVTGSDGRYKVTHKLSGYGASEYHSTLRSATQAAERLAKLFAWDMPHAELTMAMYKAGDHLRRQLRDAGREFPVGVPEPVEASEPADLLTDAKTLLMAIRTKVSEQDMPLINDWLQRYKTQHSSVSG